MLRAVKPLIKSNFTLSNIYIRWLVYDNFVCYLMTSHPVRIKPSQNANFDMDHSVEMFRFFGYTILFMLIFSASLCVKQALWGFMYFRLKHCNRKYKEKKMFWLKNSETKFRWNSTTRGLGFTEDQKQLKVAFGNPSFLVVEFSNLFQCYEICWNGKIYTV